jgi:hypothetical protein
MSNILCSPPLVRAQDGFGGGNRMEGNLCFNSVRETGDHGCYNS